MKQIKGVYLIERITNQSSDLILNQVYYIGLAVDIFDRWHQHCIGNEQYIDKMIQKLGINNFKFSILEIVSNQKELKKCETKWIQYYKEKYGENLLYNISETINTNPTKIDSSIKKQIKKLLNENIGQSIYALSEAFNIPWSEIVKIRKPLLKEKGLKYDSKVKNIISINTGSIPENWQGGQLTQKLAQKVIDLISQGKDIDKELISKGDLNSFLTVTNNGTLPYISAPDIVL